MNILIAGINGKMGRATKLEALKRGHEVVAGIDTACDKQNNVYADFILPKAVTDKIQVVVDFSLPSILEEELGYCVKNNKKLVICATGHSQKQQELIEKASEYIPIFKTTNTSIGVALVNKILAENLDTLKQYDIQIIEKHHIHKKDAPSGTAKTLLNTLKPLGRDISCHSLRAGTVCGEHQVLLFGDGEQITITHTAESRALFASGAIKIAEFMQNINSAGLYSMNDILN